VNYSFLCLSLLVLAIYVLVTGLWRSSAHINCGWILPTTSPLINHDSNKLTLRVLQLIVNFEHYPSPLHLSLSCYLTEISDLEDLVYIFSYT
jgi:hypothetical protein